MTKRSILTIMADYNSPPNDDGTRTDIIFSKYIIEDIVSGHIKAGDPLFIYFDPEGDKYADEAGYGITGTIISAEVRPAKHSTEGEVLGWITFKDDFEF